MPLTSTNRRRRRFLEGLAGCVVPGHRSFAPSGFWLWRLSPDEVRDDADRWIRTGLGKPSQGNCCRESESAGYHSVMWNGTDESGQRVASGVYLYQLIVGKCLSYTQARYHEIAGSTKCNIG